MNNYIRKNHVFFNIFIRSKFLQNLYIGVELII